VFDKFSICRTYETYETPSILPGLFGFPDMFPKQRVRTLKIEDSELPPPLSEEKSYVKVGDLVRQVPTED
jgi:hypothetical protein